MSPYDYEKLVAWFSDQHRKPAQVAFTAGSARDAATAFEAASKHQPSQSVQDVAREAAEKINIHTHNHTEQCYVCSVNTKIIATAFAPLLAELRNETEAKLATVEAERDAMKAVCDAALEWADPESLGGSAELIKACEALAKLKGGG